MRQLNLKLTHNEKEQNWSVEINGTSYNFVSIEQVKVLVSRAVAIVKGSMTDATRRPQ
jgi:hypothetical protein